MKKFRIFSKYDHVLVIKRTDRKAEIMLGKGEEHIFTSSGEYQMYQKPISNFIASNKLGLEMIDDEKKEEIKIDANSFSNENIETAEDKAKREQEEADKAQAQADKEKEEAEQAQAQADKEQAEADKAELIKAKKIECNEAIQAYKNTPKKEKQTRKELKDKIESIKEEIASLEG